MLYFYVWSRVQSFARAVCNFPVILDFDYSTVLLSHFRRDFIMMFVLALIFTQCVAVNIQRMEVPALVEVGVKSVILDCEFNTTATPKNGLVMKWFFNGSSGLVYQWIPPLSPQVIGLLKGKVDRTFRISEEPLQAYRAIKILNPTTDLSGNYTCVVSTFMEEDRRTRPMLVYSAGRNFHFLQEKRYVFLVTLKCIAEDLYPKPEMSILSKGIPLKQAVTEIKMDSWGLYTVSSTAVVHDDDVTAPWEEFVCTLSLPPAGYSDNRTTVYYPGLMPTAYIAAVEMEKHQERQANKSRAFTRTPLVIHLILCPIITYLRPTFNNL